MKKPSLKTGDLTLSCLLLSIASGIVLAYQYDYTDAYKSIITIDVTLPWGKLLRSLHWYSSQVFFILLLLHTGEHILRRSYKKSTPSNWTRLMLSVPVAVMLMFTGYVLKGDITGASAGTIAEHLARSIPIIGNWINRIFFDLSGEKLFRIYLNHILVLGITGAWFLWPHLKNRKLDIPGIFALLLFCLALGFFSPAPLSVGASDTDILMVKGPWFFLSIQEILHYLPPFWGGVFVCLVPLALLCLLPVRKIADTRWPILTIGLLLICFIVLTTMAYLR